MWNLFYYDIKETFILILVCISVLTLTKLILKMYVKSFVCLSNTCIQFISIFNFLNLDYRASTIY